MIWTSFNSINWAFVTGTGRAAGKVELGEHDLYVASLDGHPLGEFLDAGKAKAAVEERWNELNIRWAAENA